MLKVIKSNGGCKCDKCYGQYIIRSKNVTGSLLMPIDNVILSMLIFKILDTTWCFFMKEVNLE